MVSTFLQIQMDYIFFFYGLAFLFLAATTWALSYREDRQLPWKWLSLFGLTHGLNEWLDMFAFSIEDTPSYSVFRFMVMVISFLFLIEFARSGSNSLLKKQTGRWIFIPLLLPLVLGYIMGMNGLNSAARYVLAFPGAAWTCLTLWKYRQMVHPNSRTLLVVIFSMAFYGLSTSVVVPKSSYFPASLLNYDSFFAFTGVPIQLLRGVLACILAAAIWQHYCAYREKAFKTVMSAKVFRNELWLMATVFIVLSAGWLMTLSFGEYGRQNDSEHYESELELARRTLEDSVQNVSDLTKALAASPDLISIGGNSQRGLSAINSTLDRYARVIRGSICYVLDVDGTTIASSNRNTAESFVGHSYRVRPYFKEALDGVQGSYIAVGLTSRKPGYYTSYPIKNPRGKIAGVAVVKLNLEKLYIAPIGNYLGFLVNSSGLILASTKPGYFLKTLHPINENMRRRFEESKQFPDSVGLPVIPSDAVPGQFFKFHEEIVQIFRQNTSVEDLSFVLLGPMNSWKIMRLVSISLTLLVAVLLITFFVIQQRNSESSARIAVSEKLYRTLVDGSPNWIGLFDHEGRCVSINGNGLEAMGRKESEVEGRTFSEIWSKKNDPALEDSVRQVLRGDRLSFEMEQVRPNGSPKVWHVVLNPVYQNDGSVSSFVGIAIDISTRKQAEKAMQESEERFRMMFSRHNAVMLLLDPESGTIVDANRSAEIFYGYTKKQLLSMRIQDINKLSTEDIDRERRRAMAEEKNVFIFPHQRADGSIRMVEVHSTAITVQERELLFSIIHDITARTLAEEALKESEQRHREYIDNSPYGVFVTDEQGRCLQVNPAGCQMTGYTEEELLKMSIPDLLVKETFDEDILHFQTLVREGNIQCKIRFHPKNGEKRWWSVTAVKISGTRFLGFCNDITSRKLAEEEKIRLETVNRQLQKTESLSRMAGAIAHHFNNQLGAVMGNLEIAIDDLSDNVGTGEFLAAAMQASRKASEISNLMLTYLGQTYGKHMPLDLSETCRKNLLLLESAVLKDSIINVDLPVPGPIISADANQIQQVLTNLVTNACEAVEENRKSISLGVKVVSSEAISARHHFPIDWQPEHTHYACLEVADGGFGIADADIEKLFDPFFSSKFTGRGLGLSILLGLVKNHDGVVTVQSELGSGSTFRVYFPLSKEEITLEREDVIHPFLTKDGDTVLLVEDEEMIRNMTKTMLNRLGFKVFLAVDGCEAVEVFQKHMNEISVVLCDLTMPCMDGWETLSSLRQMDPGLPVVLASGHDESTVITGDHSDHLHHVFLHKPYQKEELKSALERAMAGNGLTVEKKSC